jgi:transketolase
MAYLRVLKGKELEDRPSEIQKKSLMLLVRRYLQFLLFNINMDKVCMKNKLSVDRLQKIANSIRSLTMDAVENAGSGHPGLPMGCAELGAYLFTEFLNYNSNDPKWSERDRLILSAGHGSLWLYTCLHLAGFPISIDDLKRFRQFGSKTSSHPDMTKMEEIEATTGVDGQGVSFAVGQSLALKIRGLNSKVVVLVGDGCLMEGISYEACSLAGHFNLDNLIMVYDSNCTTLDGYVKESFSEKIGMRFQAQGWDVVEIDGHCFDQIHKAFSPLRHKQKRPVIIIAHTKIGRGAPTKEGTPAAHGHPLGKAEIEKAKKFLGLSSKSFDVDPEVYSYFKNSSRCFSSQQSHLNLSQVDVRPLIKTIALPSLIPGRWASHEVLQVLAKLIPHMIVGSADLSSSDGTYLRGEAFISQNDFKARNIKYGVREFAMGGIASGMAQTGLILPVIGTFLAFIDYMKSAIRLACLMRLRVIYHFTHDSIFVGHDGPTHQPIEQLSSLRAIPGLLVIRPADGHEVKLAWLAALEYQGPAALVLSRQPLLELPYQCSIEEFLKGAYIVKHEETLTVDYLIIATGSEVQLALEVSQELGRSTRVISIPSWELFEKQTQDYKDNLLKGQIKISIEAGIDQGWHKYIGSDGLAISVFTFGECGSINDLKEHFGYTKERILKKIFDLQEALCESPLK